MGLGTGLAGAGMLSGLITFTTSIRAGLLMGVWGMANLIGKAIGAMMGGAVIDLMRLAFGDPFLSYAALFAIEVVLLILALYLTTQLNIQSSKASQEEAEVPVSA
jgi:BCD family chlorophyll transporter-like MFS transporter